jgi:hypothetical protein
VPTSGTYSFYARKFWQHGRFRWRFDNGAWTEVRNTALLDEAPIRQFVVANWVAAGNSRSAPRGSTRCASSCCKNRCGGLRCVCPDDAASSTRAASSSRVKNTTARRKAGFPLSRIPTRSKPAPSTCEYSTRKSPERIGFIQARGDKFVHGNNNRPVRFWAVNAGGGLVNLDKASVDYLARYLAKRGVNMVRIMVAYGEKISARSTWNIWTSIFTLSQP